VHQLARDFPALTFVLNGGLKRDEDIAAHLDHVHGVMLGREAYHHPWTMADWDQRFFADGSARPEREAVERAMVAYMEREAAARGTPWPNIARHMMGLWNGMPGARRWRQVWSDHRLKSASPAQVHALAGEALAPALADGAL
jgi:tRNA-dihydrouridine synthase A